MPETITAAQPIAGAYNAPELCQLVSQPPASFCEGDPREWLVELKHNGIRALAIGDVIVTREGTPFQAAYHCLEELARLTELFGNRMMFDGEYVEQGGFNATLSAFRSGRGKGCIFLFDAIPLENWGSGGWNMPLKLRKDTLRIMLEEGNFHHIKYVPYVPMIGHGRIMDVARAGWNAGQEGLVIKDPHSPYERRRSLRWIKIKQPAADFMRPLPMETAS